MYICYVYVYMCVYVICYMCMKMCTVYSFGPKG